MPLAAAFGRLRVETDISKDKIDAVTQPPSGGCVLKPFDDFAQLGSRAAAFGRLRVETLMILKHWILADQPPSGGCVLKLKAMLLKQS